MANGGVVEFQLFSTVAAAYRGAQVFQTGPCIAKVNRATRKQSPSRNHALTLAIVAENYFRFAAAIVKNCQNRLDQPETIEIR